MLVLESETLVGVEPTSTGLQPVAWPSGSSVLLSTAAADVFQSLSLKVVVPIGTIKSGPIVGSNV